MAAKPDRDEAASVYDLDAIALPTLIKFRLGGQEWRIGADPDVEVVATMLRLRDTLVEDATNEDASEAVVDAKDLIMDLLEATHQEQPVNRNDFRLTVTQLLALFGRLLGGTDIADQIAADITSAAGAMADVELSEEQRAALAAGEEDAAPLRSARRSSGRRSGSAASTSGRRRGGGA